MRLMKGDDWNVKGKDPKPGSTVLKSIMETVNDHSLELEEKRKNGFEQEKCR